MSSPSHSEKTMRINHPEDVGVARKAAAKMAYEVGLEPKAVNQVELVVTELANNLLAHGCLIGTITLRRTPPGEAEGIEIVSRDCGPGMRNADQALCDGFTTTDSLGCGLGIVRRHMDEFDIRSTADRPSTMDRRAEGGGCGTVITARKYKGKRLKDLPLVWSCYSRPCLGETANGDAFLVAREPEGLLVAVCDGLGHGPLAEKASQAAIDSMRGNLGRSLEQILRRVHTHLHHSRGVALTLVRIQPGQRTLTHAGVGNVQARLQPRARGMLAPRPGVLGIGRPPQLKISEMPWLAGGVLVLFSDGISARWEMEDLPEVGSGNPVACSNHLAKSFARRHDDATVVVVEEYRR